LDAERAKFPKIGEKFRYVGKTQAQTAQAPTSEVKPQMFRRELFSKFRAAAPTGTVDTAGSMHALHCGHIDNLLSCCFANQLMGTGKFLYLWHSMY